MVAARECAGLASEAKAAVRLSANDPMVLLHATLRDNAAAERGRTAPQPRRASTAIPGKRSGGKQQRAPAAGRNRRASALATKPSTHGHPVGKEHKPESLLLAAEEHGRRQKALDRVEHLLSHSKVLLKARPPAYEWAREVGPNHRSVLNSLEGNGPNFARLAKIGAQPLRRKGLADLMSRKKKVRR